MLFTTARSQLRTAAPQRPRRKHIRVESVVGDELFDAVVFLGHTLELPALLPCDDVDLDDDVTGEFLVPVVAACPVQGSRQAA